tara:strand:- start:72 stop:1172 length:1101 start_codon:yes stop_codon:yes gene_type:complete
MASNQNQMGPGGPGGEFYVDTAMKPTVIKPIGGGYVSNVNTSQQPQNNQQTNNKQTADPMLTQQLKSIVSQKDVFQNLAGQPKYLTNKFKHLFPKGDIPYSEMTGQQKAIADFYQGTTPNAYQQQIQNFMMSSPAAAATYKDMFPIGGSINYAMTTMPEKIMEKTMLGQGLKALTGAAENVFPAISEAFVKSKEAVGKGVDKTMKTLESGLDFVDDAINIGGIPQNITDKVGTIKDAIADAFTNQTVDPSTGMKKYINPKTFTGQSYPIELPSPLVGIPSLLNTSTDTAGIERIFKLPSNFKGDFSNQYFLGTGPGTESFKDNYLVKNPALISSDQLMGMNLNQGGLASLNNPDYNMLMNASNFGF